MEHLRKYPEQSEKLYHLTSGKCILNILKEGLKCNSDGNIFLFQDKTIVAPWGEITAYDHILRNQIFLDINRDMVFECEVSQEGIKDKLLPDKVAELTCGFQWIAIQSVIEPQYLKIRQVFQLNSCERKGLTYLNC